MRKKKKIKGHPRQPDPQFNSPIVSHLINKLMKDGEKRKARKIVENTAKVVEKWFEENQTKQKKEKPTVEKVAELKSAGESNRPETKTETVANQATKSEPTSELLKISPFLTVLDEALKNVTPSVEMKRQKAGAGSYRVPHKIDSERGLKIALRWIVQALRERPKKPAQLDPQFKKWKRKPTSPMFEKLADEIIKAANKTGKVFEKWEALQKEAEIGRAFLR